MFIIPATLIGIVFLFSSCASEDPQSARGPVRGEEHPIRFSLEPGRSINGFPHMPDQQPILVHWHYPSGATESRVGFRRWDFNADKRTDMLDVLNVEGKITARAFDFDSDGKIDASWINTDGGRYCWGAEWRECESNLQPMKSAKLDSLSSKDE
ncbi:MAG: hypothetical protein AB8C84_00495 [Oligoflexales bacterium]